MTRLLQGGHLRRNAPLNFHFDGRALQGFEGDTLASALLAWCSVRGLAPHEAPVLRLMAPTSIRGVFDIFVKAFHDGFFQLFKHA